MKKLSDTSFSN